MEFCKAFNSQTESRQPGEIVPVVISIYEDRSFTFVTKTPPASYLLMKAAGIEKGSHEPNRQKCAMITRDQLREIAKMKMEDLNANDIEAAANIIGGTAQQMGIEIGDHTEAFEIEAAPTPETVAAAAAAAAPGEGAPGEEGATEEPAEQPAE